MARTSWFAAFFLGLCLSRLALADEPVAIPPAQPQQVRQTVDRAIGYLQTESAAWWGTRKCAACHHLPMPLWALGEADRQGYLDCHRFHYCIDLTGVMIGAEEIRREGPPCRSWNTPTPRPSWPMPS
jgi:hypothetical protein